MKFSVLIPTRNRLDLLKCAITSVIKQNYDNWEIVITDNASTEDIEGYVKSLNEPRIKFSRSERDLSITENWNRSVDLSTGDYVIMIGDDDILLKNHFQIMRKLLEKHASPDLIYTNAFLYAYPNVIPNFPNGVFQPFGSLHGMPKYETPFWLDHSCRRTLMQETLKFRSIYSTNMQHALISRSLLEKVKREGKFFYSPYPDIYAMSALLLEADRILVYPKEVVVIGISSKSHGCYAINQREKDAIDFLNIKNELTAISSLQSILLPGFIVFTYWLGAIELFKLHFSLDKLNLNLDYRVYRREQINYILYHYVTNNNKSYLSNYKELMKRLSLSEKIIVVLPRLFNNYLNKNHPRLAGICKRILRLIKPSPVVATSYTPLNPPPGYLRSDVVQNRFSTILEVFDQIEPIDCSDSSAITANEVPIPG